VNFRYSRRHCDLAATAGAAAATAAAADKLADFPRFATPTGQPSRRHRNTIKFLLFLCCDNYNCQLNIGLTTTKQKIRIKACGEEMKYNKGAGGKCLYGDGSF
jgi:hypothetical protein